MAEFIAALNDLFGGFKTRAKMVETALRSPDVAFVLVTSPSPMSINEVLFFSDRLVQSGMPRGAFVVNRVRQAPAPLEGAGEAAVVDALDALHVPLDEGGAGRLLAAHADAAKLATLDAKNLEGLAARTGGDVPIVRVPELPSDVYDVRLLAHLASVLTA
jgi:anion-transporting  ArsA/GET3 family ATPase